MCEGGLLWGHINTCYCIILTLAIVIFVRTVFVSENFHSNCGNAC